MLSSHLDLTNLHIFPKSFFKFLSRRILVITLKNVDIKTVTYSSPCVEVTIDDSTDGFEMIHSEEDSVMIQRNTFPEFRILLRNLASTA